MTNEPQHNTLAIKTTITTPPQNRKHTLTRAIHGTSPATNARYVKFEDADWKLEGANEPGLYPVLPNSRTWKLDKGRKHAVLKVSRKQIPLTPAFAITAHASQGKTLPPGRTQNATCTDGTTQQMHRCK